MHRTADKSIAIWPEELTLDNAQSGKLYIEEIELTNKLNASVEIALKVSNKPDRTYEIYPKVLRIEPHSSHRVEIRLKLLKPIRNIIRDTILLKSDFFDQKFTVSIRPPMETEPARERPQKRQPVMPTKERSLLQTRIDELETDKDVAEQRLAEREKEISGLNMKLTRLEEENDEIATELSKAEGLLTEKSHVEMEFSKLQQENSELKMNLDETSKTEDYLTQVKELLKQKAPSLEQLVELSLKQERQSQERKSQKVLEILQIKDSQIEDLEAQKEDIEKICNTLDAKVKDNKVLIQNMENTINSYKKTIEDLKLDNFEKDERNKKMKAEYDRLTSKIDDYEMSEFSEREQEINVSQTVENLKQQCNEFANQIEVTEREIESRDSDIVRLSTVVQDVTTENKKLKEREDYVLELSRRQDQIKLEASVATKDKDVEIAELQSKIKTQEDHINNLLNQYASQVGSSEVLNKIVTLEEENKSLTLQLYESQRALQDSKGSMRPEDLIEASTTIEKQAKKIKQLKKLNNQLNESVGNKTSMVSELQSKLLSINEELSASASKPMVTTKTQTRKSKDAGATKFKKENNELKSTIQELEQINTELSQDMTQLAKRIDSNEAISKNIAEQTALVSRLNARISTLKNREEQALSAAAKAEEQADVIKQQLDEERDLWSEERASIERASQMRISTPVQTEAPVEFAVELQLSEEDQWTSALGKRWEQRVADLNKELTHYQMKHYEIMRENHGLKEEYSGKLTEQLEDNSKLQRHTLELQRKIEFLENQLSTATNKCASLTSKLKEIRKERESVDYEINSLRQMHRDELRKVTDQLRELELAKEACDVGLQERATQVAILMETVQEIEGNGEYKGDQRLIDLTSQLSNTKSNEASLQKSINEYKLRLHNSNNDLVQLNLERDDMRELVISQQDSLVELENSYQKCTDKRKDMKRELSSTRQDMSALQSQIARFEENERENKERINLYMSQLAESQKRNGQVLAKERQDFRDKVLKIREKSFESESGPESAIILALNQLTINLRKYNTSAPDYFNLIVRQMCDIIQDADRILLSNESKMRALEFQVSSTSYFQYYDPLTIQRSNSIIDEMELLINENKILKASQHVDTNSSLNEHVEELKRILDDRNKRISETEIKNGLLQAQVAKLEEEKQSLGLKIYSQEESLNVIFEQARNKAEDEVRQAIKMRDDEIKSYIDQTLMKFTNETSEEQKMLELGREIYTLKLQINELNWSLESVTREKDSLSSANRNLETIMEEFEKRMQRPTKKIKNVDSTDYRAQVESKVDQISRLQEEIEQLKRINSNQERKASELALEIYSLQNIPKTVGEVIATEEVDELRKELLDLKERHKVELESIKANCELQLQNHAQQLDEDYNAQASLFEDGQFPGEYKAANETLGKEMRELQNAKDDWERQLMVSDAKILSLNQENLRLKEDLHLQREAFNDIKSTLVVESTKRTTRTASPARNRSTSRGPQLQLEKGEKAAPPSKASGRIVKALISAKIAEAEATRQVKKASKAEVELRNALRQKDDRIRTLEVNNKNFERLLKLNGVTEIYIEESIETTQAELQRRIVDLEREINELHISEANSWGQYSFSAQEQFATGEEDDYGLLIDGIVQLVGQMAEPDVETHGLEATQRQVIRSLSRALGSYVKGDTLGNIVNYRPTKEEDRQLWYVELLETQLSMANSTVKGLVDFVNRVQVEIQGNLAGSAQYKGASLELAKVTKETAEQIDSVNKICAMIKADLTDIRPDISIDCGSREDQDYVYKDLAMVAENMKNKLEEELIQTKLNHSYEIAELRQSINTFKSENRTYAERCQLLERHSAEMGQVADESHNFKLSQQNFTDNLQSENAALLAELNDIKGEKQSAGKQVQKFHKELKDWKSEHDVTVKNKDTQLVELRKQNTLLKETHEKMNKEIEFYKKRSTGRTASPKKDEGLDMKVKVLQEELRLAEDRSRQEADSADRKIQQLETYNEYLKSQVEESSGRRGKGKPPKPGKDATADLELAIHSKDLEINNLRKNYDSQIKAQHGQLVEVQNSLREKISSLDEEVRKRIEAEKKLRTAYEEKEDLARHMNSLSSDVASEKSAAAQGMESLQEQIAVLRQEKESLIQKLDEKAESAEKLMAFVREVEENRKLVEGQFRTENSGMTKQVQILENKLMKTTKKDKKSKEKCSQLESDNIELLEKLEALAEHQKSNEGKLSEFEILRSAVSKQEANYADELNMLNGENERFTQHYEEEIRQFKEEAKQTTDEYERAISLYAAQVSVMRQNTLADLQAKKGNKKAQDTIDSWMQIAKKDSMIKNLKTELKKAQRKSVPKPAKDPAPKPTPTCRSRAAATVPVVETTTPQPPQLDEQAMMAGYEVQINKLKSQLRTLQGTLETERYQAEQLQEALNTQSVDQSVIKAQSNKKELAEMEKRHRKECQKLAEEMYNLREKWHSPEEWGHIQQQCHNYEDQIKRLNSELARKKELLDNLQALRGQQESEANALHDEIETIKDQSDKLKRLKGEVNRKDRAIAGFKEDLENYKLQENRLYEDNAALVEKVKAMKADMTRKESLLKDVRGKLDNKNNMIQGNRTTGDQVEKLKEQVRKLKLDIERKDNQIKAIKTKLETAEIELDQAKHESSQVERENFTTLEKEIKKNERMSAQLKKNETKLQQFYIITRRIFRDLAGSVEALRSRFKSGSLDENYYSECREILNIPMDELYEFIEPTTNITRSTASIDHIERIFDDQQIDTNEAINTFARLMDERIELEKSQGDVSAKYEDYIKRMKDDITNERKGYETKIKKLEKSLRKQSVVSK